MSDRPTIECKPNGPYVVKSLENLSDATGAGVASTPVMALCRCDGTHWRIGFKDGPA